MLINFATKLFFCLAVSKQKEEMHEQTFQVKLQVVSCVKLFPEAD